MPHYLHQVAYSREGWNALLSQPQDVQTTPLMSTQEAMQALKKANESGYKPITATARAA